MKSITWMLTCILMFFYQIPDYIMSICINKKATDIDLINMSVSDLMIGL